MHQPWLWEWPQNLLTFLLLFLLILFYKSIFLLSFLIFWCFYVDLSDGLRDMDSQGSIFTESGDSKVYIDTLVYKFKKKLYFLKHGVQNSHV